MKPTPNFLIGLTLLLSSSTSLAHAQIDDEGILTARKAFWELYDRLNGVEVGYRGLGGGLEQGQVSKEDQLGRVDDGDDDDDDDDDDEPKPLTGRFLHLTDFHPDPWYIHGGSFDQGCHRKNEKKKKKKKVTESDHGLEAGFKGDEGGDEEDTAGIWGSSSSDCDTPMSLVNLTFDWLKTEWAGKVDFVIWTGDNARHDIDSQIPRTPSEINQLNRMMARKMRETFGEDTVIVPSLGNNDIYPHNILAPGPNTVTNEFTNIWSDFIPDEEYHIFQRGAYYAIEVIPDQLAVISLNTLFWYDANKVVDGCKDGSDEPGALEFDWLEVQLDSFRDRGMQVWLTGHVPPHMGRYFDNCYLRYGELALRYQDTIVGHLYGHMNVDHFFFIDVDELEATTASGKLVSGSSSNDDKEEDVEDSTANVKEESRSRYKKNRIHTMGRVGDTALAQELYKDFSDMPDPSSGPGKGKPGKGKPGKGKPGKGKKGKKGEKIKMEDYTVVNVAASLIPTYLPGIRVYNYNVSSYESSPNLIPDRRKKKKNPQKPKTPKKGGGHRHPSHPPAKDCKLPEHEDQPHCKFRTKPRFFSEDSPSRRNTLWSPVGFVQFFLGDLGDHPGHGRGHGGKGGKGGKHEEGWRPEWEVEYVSYSVDGLLRGGREGEEGGVKGRERVPWKFLPGYEDVLWGNVTTELLHSELEVEEDRKDDKEKEDDPTGFRKFRKGLKKIAPFKMDDLTIGSYLDLAKRLVKEEGLWGEFEKYMYVSSKVKE